MHNENALAMAAFRLDQSKECMHDAEVLLAAGGSFKAVANRSYYCIFHAMRAVLALENFDSKKHSGVISQFRVNYMKTSVFPKELSDIITKAFEIRNDSDYHDLYIVPKEDVMTQFENAKIFLSAIEEYLMRTVPEIASVNVKATDCGS